jgi:glutaredoxin
MKNKAIWYHAGCAVCVTAENGLVGALDRQRFDVEKVDLGEDRSRVAEAEAKGVRTVPALVLGDQVFHVNFGAELSALK